MNRVYQLVILILFGVILYLQMCNKPKPCPPTPGPATIVKRDTVWRVDSTSKQVSNPKPEKEWWEGVTAASPQSIKKWKKWWEHVPISVDTFHLGFIDEKPVFTREDTLAIIKKYLSTQHEFFKVRSYRDSLKFRFGTFYVYDTVSQNRLTGQRLSIQSSVPEITNTAVQKPRNQWYGGVSILGDKAILVNAVEISLAVKNRKDQQYEVGISKPWDRPLQFRVGTKFKFSFR